MAERVALGILPGTGWQAREVHAIAQAAEAAGSQDAIDCGEGLDRVIANDNDRVADDCETVEVVIAPELP